MRFVNLLFKEITSVSKAWYWFFSLIILFSLSYIILTVDLSPKVENDFFFSTDDPQLQATQKISEKFPSRSQIIITISGKDILSENFLEKIGFLTKEFSSLHEVSNVFSLTKGPDKPHLVPKSEFWKRLLLSKDNKSTNIVLSLKEKHDESFIEKVEKIACKYNTSDFHIEISGVPYVIEQIRRHLVLDLKTFSIASIFIFGFFIFILFRSWSVVLCTVVTCITSCIMTLGLLYILHIPIGILTTNIATIVFVLTLSHVIFITSNWQQISQTAPDNIYNNINKAVKETFNASFWCMLTTFFGFLSLLLAQAKPLRELGISGAIGSGVAIVMAYAIYPILLAIMPKKLFGKKPAIFLFPKFLLKLRLKPFAIGLIILPLLTAYGLFYIKTDPSLLSYFQKGSKLLNGLESVDKNLGSSTFNIVVRDSDNNTFYSDDVYKKLQNLQNLLESDPSTGMVLSLSVLFAEGERNPVATLFDREHLLDLLASDKFDYIALDFVTKDRKQSLFSILMHESTRTVPRETIIAGITEKVRKAGFIPELIGGLFPLQSEMSKLILNSIYTGLGGLTLLFTVIAILVSGSIRITFNMLICIVSIPVFMLGLMGYLKMPLDIIVSPSANVALGIGIDSMIHLVMRVKRIAKTGGTASNIWIQARNELFMPIMGTAVIVTAGFGVFSLSSFPPNQIFGMAVVMGTIFAGATALVTLPYLSAKIKKV